MAINNYTPFKMPTIDFGVAGTTETYRFNLVTNSGASFNLQGGHVFFSLTDASNPNLGVLVSKELTLKQDDQGLWSIAEYEPEVEDTIDLNGKYLYQISAFDVSGKKEAGIGVMLITKNTDKDIFID